MGKVPKRKKKKKSNGEINMCIMFILFGEFCHNQIEEMNYRNGQNIFLLPSASI